MNDVQNTRHTLPPFDLAAAARQTAVQHGFELDLSAAAAQELATVLQRSPQPAPGIRDLRPLLWSSIDNDTSRDLDQIEFAESLPNGDCRVLVGIADVDAFVPQDSPLDAHAARNTTSLYTGISTFMMLPEQLSAGSTSLLEGQDRLAVIIEFTVVAASAGSGASIASSDIYPALVTNRAQLTYRATGDWLAGAGAAPPKIAASLELQSQLQLQHHIAQRLRNERYRHGALDIETIEPHPILLKGEVVDIEAQTKNPASELIEDFMIAANGVVARTLAAEHRSSIRRVVRTPKRWDRIVELAAQHGGKLPAQPDSKALNDFLSQQRTADPTRFPDLSLAVIKLLGPGEYVLERPGDLPEGHFGLAVEDYTHSTAPNRRYADLVTQRLLKASFTKTAAPYPDEQLAAIATNCTRMGDAERKVEREMQKRIAAVAMSGRIGQQFQAIVTGVNPHGTFVRVLAPHVEGMLVRGAQGIDVGDKLRVQLVRTDPVHGFIDFARA